MDQDKGKAIEEWQPPMNVYELRSFLGLANLLSVVCDEELLKDSIPIDGVTKERHNR